MIAALNVIRILTARRACCRCSVGCHQPIRPCSGRLPVRHSHAEADDRRISCVPRSQPPLGNALGFEALLRLPYAASFVVASPVTSRMGSRGDPATISRGLPATRIYWRERCCRNQRSRSRTVNPNRVSPQSRSDATFGKREALD